MKKEFLTTLKILIAAFIITLGVNYIHAWSSPSCSPPNCNIDAPLNVSKLGQEKYGSILLDGTDQNNNPFTYGLTVLNGIVSFGGVTLPATNLKLGVVGKVGATGYCDTAGANCNTPSDINQTININTSKAVYFKNEMNMNNPPWLGGPNSASFHKTGASGFITAANGQNNPLITDAQWTQSDIAAIKAATGEVRPIQALIVGYYGLLTPTAANDHTWYKIMINQYTGAGDPFDVYGATVNIYVPAYNSSYGRDFGGIIEVPIDQTGDNTYAQVMSAPATGAITGSVTMSIGFNVIGYITN